MRGAQENGVAHLQRRFLIFRAVRAGADRSIARVISPGHLEVLDVVAGDLIKRDKAAAARSIAVMFPVLLLRFRRYGRQRGRLAIEGDRRMRNEHAGKTGAGGDGKNRRNRKRRAQCRRFPSRTSQQRVRQGNNGCPDADCQQAGNQRPEI